MSEKIKPGQQVKIKNNDLTNTRRYYGLDLSGTMLKMRGNIYTVIPSSSDERIRVKDPVSRNTFLFCITDVSILRDPPKLPDPELFDIENLVI